MAEGKSVTFTKIEGDPTEPEWTRFLLGGEVRLLQKKEVRGFVCSSISGPSRISRPGTVYFILSTEPSRMASRR
jgi:hypothetical protein